MKEKSDFKSPPDKEDLGGLPFMPYNGNLKAFSRANRKNPTLAELKMWKEILGNDQLNGLRFHRQKPLDNFIADFYCPKLKLIIEIDGDSHYEEGAQEYDEHRTEKLEYYGLKVIRYTNADVLENIDGTYEDLTEKIEIRRKDLNL